MAPIVKEKPLSDDKYNLDQMREQIHRQMLSTVSHDLKTPLATIIGSLEIFTRMDEKLSGDKKKMLINSALVEAYRLDSFITNILDMAKLETGMVNIKREKIDLNALVQDCLIRLGPKRDRGEFELVPMGENMKITTDPMLVSRSVGFLLDNALKHAGPQPKIRVEYGIQGEDCVIRVSDSGGGIPAGRNEDIFSKYTRLGKSDQQNAGTGLGLSICRQLIGLLGGTVMGENHEDGGAVFTITFPVQE